MPHRLLEAVRVLLLVSLLAIVFAACDDGPTQVESPPPEISNVAVMPNPQNALSAIVTQISADDSYFTG